MPVEIELKVHVDSHEPIRAALAAAGAKRFGAVVETNHFFDSPDMGLLGRGAGLRVREAISIGPSDETGPAMVTPIQATTHTTMTFKGPQQVGPFKTRGEIEFAVGGAAAAINLLTAVGFLETLRFQKRRESWTLGDCNVELDELPRLGRFVEVEGPTDDAIRAVALKLGLDPSASIRESYAALLAATVPPDSPRPLVIAFD